MTRILIRGPHSHSSRRRITQAFKQASIEYKPVVISLGMTGRGAVIPDTQTALELARKHGASKSKVQWAHLSQE